MDQRRKLMEEGTELWDRAGGLQQLADKCEELCELTKECRRRRGQWYAERKRGLHGELLEVDRKDRSYEVHSIARRLASTGVGARRRFYGGAKTLPTVAGIETKLGAETEKGGLMATKVDDYEKELEEYIEKMGPSPLQFGTEFADMAQEGLANLRRQARNAIGGAQLPRGHSRWNCGQCSVIRTSAGRTSQSAPRRSFVIPVFFQMVPRRTHGRP